MGQVSNPIPFKLIPFLTPNLLLIVKASIGEELPSSSIAFNSKMKRNKNFHDYLPCIEHFEQIKNKNIKGNTIEINDSFLILYLPMHVSLSFNIKVQVGYSFT